MVKKKKRTTKKSAQTKSIIKLPFTRALYKQVLSVVKLDKEASRSCRSSEILLTARKRLRKLGWTSKYVGRNASTDNIYISKNGKFILKKHYQLTRKLPPRHFMIPTVTFPRQEKGRGNWRWVLQPMAYREAKHISLAMRKFRKITALEDLDLHRGNVGIWRNTAVFFDW